MDLDPNHSTLTEPWTPHEHPLLDPACDDWAELVHQAADRLGAPIESQDALRHIGRAERIRKTRGLRVDEVFTLIRARASLRENVERWATASSEDLVGVVAHHAWPVPLAGPSLSEYASNEEHQHATGTAHPDETRVIGLSILPDAPVMLRLHPRLREVVATVGHPNPRGRVLVRWTTHRRYTEAERLLDVLEAAPANLDEALTALCRDERAATEWRLALAGL